MDITRSTETEFKIRDFNKSTTTLLPLQDQVFNYPEKSKTNQLFYCPIHDLRRYRPESENYTLPIVKVRAGSPPPIKKMILVSRVF